MPPLLTTSMIKYVAEMGDRKRKQEEWGMRETEKGSLLIARHKKIQTFCTM